MMGTNANLFPEILRLYSEYGDKIWDATYGRGVFWRNVDMTEYDVTTSDAYNRNMQIVCDCLSLPFSTVSRYY